MYALTPIHWISPEAANVWRVVVWAVMVFLIGDYLTTIPRAVFTDRIAWWAIFGRASLLVFMLKAAIVMAERWDETPTIEGVPATTLAVALAAASRLMYRRARARGGAPVRDL